ncbi:MAG: hypothetical protein ACK41D_10620 [Rubricoccaceae bacterium]
MAKTRRPQRASSFEFQTISKDEAAKRRSQRGQRRSKYSVIGDKFGDLSKNEVLVFQAQKNEVQGVRNFMRRNFGEAFRMRSRRVEGDTFEVHLSHD